MPSSCSTLLSIAACNSQPQSFVTLPSSTSSSSSSCSTLVYAGHGNVFHLPLNGSNPSPQSLSQPENASKISCLCSVKLASSLSSATDSFVAASADGSIKLYYSLSESPTAQSYPAAAATVTCVAALRTKSSTIIACGTTQPDGNGVTIYTNPTDAPTNIGQDKNLMVEALDVFTIKDTIVLVAGCALARSNQIYVFSAPLTTDSTPVFTLAGSLSGHQDWVRCFSSTASFNSNSTSLLLASGSHDHKIRLWNFQTSKDKVDSHIEVDEDVDVDALLEDQARLCFTVNEDNIKVTLEALLIGHEESVTSLSFSPKSAVDEPITLLSSSMDRTLLVWQVTESSGVWMPVARVGSAGGIVGGSVGNSLLGFCCAKWGQGGEQIVAQGYGGSVHIWSADMSVQPPLFTPLPCITGHFAPTTDLSWEPTRGTYLLSASKDQTARLWANTDEGWRELGRPQVHGYDMTSLVCVGGGRARGGEVLHRFVSGADEKILRVFDAPGATIKLLSQLTSYQSVDEDDKERPAERAFLPSLGLSNKGGDGTGEEKGNEEMDDGGTDGNSFGLPSERDLGVETLWPEVRKLYGHDTEVIALASTAQSLRRDPMKKIVVASSCKSRDAKNAGIKLWNVEGNSCIKTLEDGHKSSVACLAFSSDGSILASSGKDRRLCLWSIDPSTESNSSKLQLALDGAHKRIVWSLSFCQDTDEGNSVLISGSRDMTAKVWRFDPSAKSISNLQTIKFGESVTSLSFAYPSDFGSGVCGVGFESGKLKIIKLLEDYSSHDVALEIENGHVATVKKLAWRPMDGGELTLASAGLDHAVKIFSVKL
ncbi:hypothetical protein TrVE_jg9942 [Triparma verrucosa]|uniref:Elongator complex protein 2 n=1 Tax=Triparma verrucosa TaxID=1606542 RepID=A0A9W7EW61_9STRA|nr:hypothetical protein TrVE_jg9942 [Triparma verrucosa]